MFQAKYTKKIHVLTAPYSASIHAIQKKGGGGGGEVELNDQLLHISVHTDTPSLVLLVVPGLSWINRHVLIR